MAARILDLCDAIVTLIGSNWSPTAPDAVTREYGPDVGLDASDSATLIVGRKVYVFPTSYAVPQLQDRELVDKRYSAVALVIERYTDAGTPPTEWMDERVLFAEGLYKLLRDPDLVLLDTAIPDLENGSTVDVVYDIVRFAEQRTFWSQMTLNFQEATAL